MKTIWKWILGLLIVFLVAAALGAVGLIFRRSTMGSFMGGMPYHQGWNAGPMMRGYGEQVGPMMRGDSQRYGPMMQGGRGFGAYSFLGGLGSLLHLAFFGLLLYGAYSLGRRNARVVMDPRTPAPVSPPPAPEPPADDNIPPAS